MVTCGAAGDKVGGVSGTPGRAWTFLTSRLNFLFLRGNRETLQDFKKDNVLTTWL